MLNTELFSYRLRFILSSLVYCESHHSLVVILSVHCSAIVIFC